MRIGEGDHKLTMALFRSEQNLFVILCLTLVMLFIFHFRTLCSCVGAAEGYHSH